MNRYILRLKNLRTGEWFRSKLFDTFDAAAAYGDRLDSSRWLWSIEPA
jgi:hypothetical protein